MQKLDSRSPSAAKPTRTTVQNAEDLAPLVGTELGASSWQQIDQKMVDAFAEVTCDRQWIHIDSARAEDGPFGGTVAHGFLTLSLTAWFLEQALHVRDAGLRINYGLNRVRFTSPVATGSSIRGVITLLGLERLDESVQAELRSTVEIAGQAKPACIADVLIHYPRAPSATSS